MDLKTSEALTSLLFAPDYLPDVHSWLKKQNGTDKIQTSEELTKILSISSWDCWNIFLRALHSPTQLSEEEVRSYNYKLLTDTGVANIERITSRGNGIYQYNLIVRNDIREKIEENDLGKFIKKKSRKVHVHAYALAAANVYGVIDADSFIRIFNQFMTEPEGELEKALGIEQAELAKAELEEILAPYTEMNVDVLFIDDKLVSRMIWKGHESDITDFIGRTYGGNYNSFSKSELLLYVNKDYYKRTPEVSSFEKLFSEKLPFVSKTDLEACFLVFSPTYLIEWKEIIEYGMSSFLKGFSDDDLQIIAEAFIDAKNSIPCWEYKGFSKGKVLRSSGLDAVEKEVDVDQFLKILRQ